MCDKVTKESLYNLVDQLIEMAKAQESELRMYRFAHHKGSKTLGEGALLFHLKQLKPMLEEFDKKNQVRLDFCSEFGKLNSSSNAYLDLISKTRLE